MPGPTRFPASSERAHAIAHQRLPALRDEFFVYMVIPSVLVVGDLPDPVLREQRAAAAHFARMFFREPAHGPALSCHGELTSTVPELVEMRRRTPPWQAGARDISRAGMDFPRTGLRAFGGNVAAPGFSVEPALNTANLMLPEPVRRSTSPALVSSISRSPLPALPFTAPAISWARTLPDPVCRRTSPVSRASFTSPEPV